MAIKSPTGVYCKIDFERCCGGTIAYQQFASAAIRANPGQFDKVVTGSVEAGPRWEAELASAPKGETLRDSLIRSGYACLKQDSQFANWEDC